jgi:hypothetical protein
MHRFAVPSAFVSGSGKKSRSKREMTIREAAIITGPVDPGRWYRRAVVSSMTPAHTLPTQINFAPCFRTGLFFARMVPRNPAVVVRHRVARRRAQ